MWKRLLRPTNRRVRLLVGLFLAGLFCIQCTRTEAIYESRYIVAIGGRSFGHNPSDVVRGLEELAESDHIVLLKKCLANYERNYRDFTCTFIKQERIHGEFKPEQEISVKHMISPFSVAMAWTRNAPIGDRVLYVEGKYNDQMLVRPKSKFLRTLVGGYVLREPDGKEAMKNTLRPVNMFGFGRGLKGLIDVYTQAKRKGDLKIARGENAKVAGRDCVVLIRYLPPKNDYPAWKTLTYIDVEYMVPICIEGYDWDKKRQCRYLYKDLKFNVGLTEDDFTPRANDMKRAK